MSGIRWRPAARLRRCCRAVCTRSDIAIALVLVSFLGSACASSAEIEQPAPVAHQAPAQPQAASAPVNESLERYEEKIPGTLVTLEMIPVPAGSVTIQTPEGEKTVEVGPFWISKTEIPWEAYDAFVLGLDLKRDGTDDEMDAMSRPSKPYVLPGDNFGHDGRPALGMTSLGAVAFSGWLSYKTGRTYRLPTEAEWEYACRAGQSEPTGDMLKEYAWYWDNADAQTQKVGQLSPNAWGIHDMLGNVAEWILADNGIDAEAVKGGSWRSFPEEISCSAKAPYSPDWQATDPQIPKSTWWLSDGPFVGLRLVRLPD